MNKPNADIHVSSKNSPMPMGEHLDDSLGKWFRPTLALAVEERGLKPVFSRGTNAYDFDEGTALILNPRIEKTGDVYSVRVTPVTVAMDSIAVIRNIAPALGNGLPELNHPDVRALARDKAATNAVLAKVGLTKHYAKIGSPSEINDALAAIPEDRVVLKPRFGKKGQQIYRGTKAEIATQAGALDLAPGWVAEEELDLSLPVPLKGADAEQDELISLVNRNGLPKELRIYTFGRDSDGKLITSSVLRASMPGHEDFGQNLRVYIDETSIPEELTQKTAAIATEFEKTTGVKEMHLAVDWALAKRQSGVTAWLPMEINGTEPVLVYENENRAVSRDQAAKLAEQMYRISQKGGVR